MPHLHFITFGDGSPLYRGAGTRLARSAIRTGVFRTVKAYNLALIKRDYPEFWQAHREFIVSNQRGLGYWLWKPFIVSCNLSGLADEEWVLYCDAGCEIRGDKTSEIVDMLPTAGADIAIVPLDAEHTIGRWTHSRCIRELDGAKYQNLPEFSASYFIFRNSPKARAFVETWLKHCFSDEYQCLIDQPNEAHRHDQSIMSLLLYRWEQENKINIRRLRGASWSDMDFPILGVRNRTPFRSIGRPKVIIRVAAKVFEALASIMGSEARYRARLAVTRTRLTP